MFWIKPLRLAAAAARAAPPGSALLAPAGPSPVAVRSRYRAAASTFPRRANRLTPAMAALRRRLSVVNCWRAPIPPPVRRIATRSPGPSCFVDQAVQKVARPHRTLEREREVVDHDRHRTRRNRGARGNDCRLRICGRGRARVRTPPQVHVTKVRDRPLAPFGLDLEILRLEVGDVAALLVGDHGVHLDELGADADDHLGGLRGLSRGARRGNREQAQAHPDGNPGKAAQGTTCCLSSIML